MTRVRFSADEKGLYGFEISGHSSEDGDDEIGKIVCAAVSALSQAVANGLKSVVHAPVMFDQNDGNASLTVCLTPECTKEQLEKSQILLDTLYKALQAIARDYPRNVRIIFKERRKYTCSA